MRKIIFAVWLVLIVLMIVKGWYTALLILGVLSLPFLYGAINRKKHPTGRIHPDEIENARRIDRLHYIDLDEHECPVCGATFRKDVMVCPECGTKFVGKEEIEDEFVEEMMLWDDDD